MKPSNILITINQTQEEEPARRIRPLTGFLTDFDFIQKIGILKKINPNYPYWDSLSRLGIATPFCDCYGLAISMLAWLKTPTLEVSTKGILNYTVLKDYVQSLENINQYGTNRENAESCIKRLFSLQDKKNSALRGIKQNIERSHHQFTQQFIGKLPELRDFNSLFS